MANKLLAPTVKRCILIFSAHPNHSNKRDAAYSSMPAVIFVHQCVPCKIISFADKWTQTIVQMVEPIQRMNWWLGSKLSGLQIPQSFVRNKIASTEIHWTIWYSWTSLLPLLGYFKTFFKLDQCNRRLRFPGTSQNHSIRSLCTPTNSWPLQKVLFVPSENNCCIT